jgi:hypothetical protein
MQPAQYKSLVITLVDGGFVRRDRKERPYDSGLSLTATGVRAASFKKADFMKLWQAAIAGAVEGGGRLLFSMFIPA